MQNKPYKKPETETVYSVNPTDTASADTWNPNVPFHGTQEEWWEHFHNIEEGTFHPVEEIFQRIEQWLKSYDNKAY